MSKVYRLAVLTSHPIQYQAPLWRKLATHPQIDLSVYFCSKLGLVEQLDPEFGVKLKWDIPLLDGYGYKFLRNFSPIAKRGGFWSFLNLGIIREVFIERFDALFVHSYALATNLMAIVVSRALGTKVLVRNELHLGVRTSRSRRWIKSLVLPRVFRLCDGFMAIGTLNKEYLIHCGAPEHKIFLMPYAVNNEWFFAQREKLAPLHSQLKGELGLDGRKVILYVGKLLERKHPMDLIKAVERLSRTDIALVIVGDGAQRRYCEEYCRERHMSDSVRFMGFRNQKELAPFYTLADVLVLPSEREPWGLVINEAMCFGLPVICTTQVGAWPDLVRHGDNGFVYEAGDIDALRQYLGLALADGARERMGRVSIEMIQKWGYAQDVEAVLNALART